MRRVSLTSVFYQKDLISYVCKVLHNLSFLSIALNSSARRDTQSDPTQKYSQEFDSQGVASQLAQGIITLQHVFFTRSWIPHRDASGWKVVRSSNGDVHLSAIPHARHEEIWPRKDSK